MKSNFSKGMLMTALITGTVLCSSAAAFCRRAAGVYAGPDGCNGDENGKA